MHLIAPVSADCIVLVDDGHHAEVQQLRHYLLKHSFLKSGVQFHWLQNASGCKKVLPGITHLQVGAPVFVAEVEGGDQHLRRGDVVPSAQVLQNAVNRKSGGKLTD